MLSCSYYFCTEYVTSISVCSLYPSEYLLFCLKVLISDFSGQSKIPLPFLVSIPFYSMASTRMLPWTVDSLLDYELTWPCLCVWPSSGTFFQAFPGLCQLWHEVFLRVLPQMVLAGCPEYLVPSPLRICNSGCIPENLRPISCVSQQTDWSSITRPWSTPDRL